jgi:hypothetical protein
MMYLCILAAFAAGAVIGLGAGRRIEHRRDVAPLPEYDRENPINAQARETIQIDGITLYRVQ